MAHDGQDLSLGSAILPDLLDVTGAAIAPVEAVFEFARTRVRDIVSVDGKVSGAAIEANQTAAHGLAWLATYHESLRQMQGWAERLQADGTFGEVEQLLHQIAFGEYLAQIVGGIQMNQGEIVRLRDLGLGSDALMALCTDAVTTLMRPRQHPGRPHPPCRADAGARGRDHRGPHRSRRGARDDPRAVPPLRRGKGRAPCP